jgi:hypothetical protein
MLDIRIKGEISEIKVIKIKLEKIITDSLNRQYMNGFVVVQQQ